MFEVLRADLRSTSHALRALRFLQEFPRRATSVTISRMGLFREVAYSTLLEEQKRHLHLVLARRLRQVLPIAFTSIMSFLPIISRSGENRRRRFYHLVKAADHQFGLGAGASAAENYREAIELLRALPPSPSLRILMARVLNSLRTPSSNDGDVEQAEEMLAGARECAQSHRK